MRVNRRQPKQEGLQEKGWIWGDDGQEEISSSRSNGWGQEEDEEADDGRTTLIEKLIERIGTQLESGEAPAKASVSDLIRLMQWERELNPRQARKFVVEWIDPKPEEL